MVHQKKPTNPWPPILRRMLRHLLPQRVYRRRIGRHEDTSLMIWRRLARAISPGAAILDVGAFQGEFSLAAREENQAAPIYAFEPNPASLDLLRTSCESKRIHVVEAAVGDRDGVVAFWCEGQQSHIAEDVKTMPAGDPRMSEVSVVALDSWSLAQNIDVALIKIDVEGAEHAVLRGAKRLLESHSPVVLSEVLSDAAADRAMTELSGDYTFWHIDENAGRITEEQRITRRLWRNKNWLLVPEAKRSLLKATLASGA